MTERALRKKRSTNFTHNECKLLVNLIADKYSKIIENKTNDAFTWKQKEDAWKELSKDFNSESETYRSVKTLKMKYDGLKKFLKKKYFRNKLEVQKTGTGKSIEFTYSDIETKLLSILNINLEGLRSSFNTDERHLIYVVNPSNNYLKDLELDAVSNHQTEPLIEILPSTSEFNGNDTDTVLDTEVLILEPPKDTTTTDDTATAITNDIPISITDITNESKQIRLAQNSPNHRKQNQKLSSLVDGKAKLLTHRLLIAEQRIKAKELELRKKELELKERELQCMNEEHELKMNILRKQYANL